MTISKEKEAEILRFYHVEKWPVGTISKELHVHHDAIHRVLSHATGTTHNERTLRDSIIDPYLPFIRETLEKYPNLCASRLYGMVKERDYPGGPDHFRHLIAEHRPRKTPEAFLRLKTLPGDQGQIDWGLCRARHRPHYADNQTMLSPTIKDLIFLIHQRFNFNGAFYYSA